MRLCSKRAFSLVLALLSVIVSSGPALLPTLPLRRKSSALASP